MNSHVQDEVGSLLAVDTTESGEQEARMPAPHRKMATLLRTIGAVVLLTAATTFLVQQWQGADYVLRYFLFLSFTLFLSASGFFAGVKLGDDKGARTFLAVAAAIIPVHFCQLGALLYSCLGDPDPSRYPVYALWIAPSISVACSTVLIGVTALTPVMILSLTTLVRSRGRQLSTLYLFMNALLLIPTRNSDTIGLLILASIVALMIFELRVSRVTPVLATFEGCLARIMLVTPALLLCARTVHLYSVSTLFMSLTLMTLAIAIFCLPRSLQAPASVRSLFEGVSVFPAVLSTLFLAVDIIKTTHCGEQVALLLLTVPAGLIFLAVSLIASRFRATYCSIGMHILVGCALMNLSIFGGIESSIGCILVGIATLISGYLARSMWATWLGTVSFGAGILYTVRNAFLEIYTLSPWVSLAVVGVLILFASSCIERYGVEIRRVLNEFRQHFTVAEKA